MTQSQDCVAAGTEGISSYLPAGRASLQEGGREGGCVCSRVEVSGRLPKPPINEKSQSETTSGLMTENWKWFSYCDFYLTRGMGNSTEASVGLPAHLGG